MPVRPVSGRHARAAHAVVRHPVREIEKRGASHVVAPVVAARVHDRFHAETRLDPVDPGVDRAHPLNRADAGILSPLDVDHRRQVVRTDGAAHRADHEVGLSDRILRGSEVLIGSAHEPSGLAPRPVSVELHIFRGPVRQAHDGKLDAATGHGAPVDRALIRRDVDALERRPPGAHRGARNLMDVFVAIVCRVPAREQAESGEANEPALGKPPASRARMFTPPHDDGALQAISGPVGRAAAGAKSSVRATRMRLFLQRPCLRVSKKKRTPSRHQKPGDAITFSDRCRARGNCGTGRSH